MPRGFSLLFVLVLSAVLLVPGWSRAVDVDCAQPNVPANAVGQLTVDIGIDCNPAGPVGINIGRNGTLMMNGHTVSGNGAGGVLCDGGKCSVIGPGQVVGAPVGIYAPATRQLIVTDVDVSGNGWGIYQDAGKMRLTNVTANGNEYGGILGDRMFLEQVTANDNGEDAEPQSGIEGVTINATDVTANGNKVAGISAGRRVKAANVTTNGNAVSGIQSSGACRLTVAGATGNQHGVWCYSGVIDGATLTGNTVADILAGPRGPRVRNTTCDNSFRPGSSFPGAPAGLCSAN